MSETLRNTDFRADVANKAKLFMQVVFAITLVLTPIFLFWCIFEGFKSWQLALTLISCITLISSWFALGNWPNDA